MKDTAEPIDTNFCVWVDGWREGKIHWGGGHKLENQTTIYLLRLRPRTSKDTRAPGQKFATMYGRK